MVEPIIPFLSKDVILLKAIRCEQDLLGCGFEFAPNVNLVVPKLKGFASVIFVNWKKVIFKAIGPIQVGNLNTIIMSAVKAYGDKLISATGDPQKEVCIRILL